MKTFLFDFDGTLVDSMPTYVSSMLRILDENGVSYGDDIVKIITPLGLIRTAEYFIELGVKLPHAEIYEKMKQYMAEEYFYNIPEKLNVTKTLLELKKRGVRLNVLTASPHATLDPCLKRLGLFDLFENVWSCDDFGTTKADPDIYVQAADRLGVAPQDILFLDDNLNADTTAKTAGLVVCGVYDKSSEEYTEQMKAATDFYIDDFWQLIGLLPEL